MTTTSTHLHPVPPLPASPSPSALEETTRELTFLAQTAAIDPASDRASFLAAAGEALRALTPADVLAITTDLLEQLRDQMITVNSYRAGITDLPTPF